MKRIPLNQLVVGVPLPFSAYDENHNLLLREGVVLSNERQLEILLTRGLYMEEAGAKDAGTKDAGRKAPSELRAPEPATLVEELERIRRELNTLVSAKPISSDGFAARVLGLATRLQNACQKDADCCLAAFLLDRASRYAVRHMMHVAVVCQIVGEGAGLDDSSRFSVIAAGLTMNLSMLDMQDSLQSMQGTQISPAQRAAIHEHPNRSAQMLQALGVTDPYWLKFVLCHHESIDGAGYPKGLKGDEIPLGAQIIALADGYTARLEHRADRDAKAPNQSLREIFMSRGKGVDPMLAALLVKRVGIFPPGLLVELENGETAIVTRRTDNANAPEVHAILSPQHTLYTRPLRRGTERSPFTIRSSLQLEQVRAHFNPMQFWTG